MIHFYNVIGENIKEHPPNWPNIPGHTCTILIIECFRSGKTNRLISLISQ